jgi:hypothetical protein
VPEYLNCYLGGLVKIVVDISKLLILEVSC